MGTTLLIFLIQEFLTLFLPLWENNVLKIYRITKETNTWKCSSIQRPLGLWIPGHVGLPSFSWHCKHTSWRQIQKPVFLLLPACVSASRASSASRPPFQSPTHLASLRLATPYQMSHCQIPKRWAGLRKVNLYKTTAPSLVLFCFHPHSHSFPIPCANISCLTASYKGISDHAVIQFTSTYYSPVIYVPKKKKNIVIYSCEYVSIINLVGFFGP